MTDETTVTVTAPPDPEDGPPKAPPTPWNELSLFNKIMVIAIILIVVVAFTYVVTWHR